MGRWYTPREWIRKYLNNDLREVCREKYGDDFAKKYDDVNRGLPIGGLEETMNFLEKIESVKAEINGNGKVD